MKAIDLKNFVFHINFHVCLDVNGDFKFGAMHFIYYINRSIATKVD